MSNARKPVSRLSEKTGLPGHQTGLQADLPGLGFDLQPNPNPSLKKPVGAGASPFCKAKTSLSSEEKVVAVNQTDHEASLKNGGMATLLTPRHHRPSRLPHRRWAPASGKASLGNFLGLPPISAKLP
ncbi:hypothetical protein C8R45DRAFT_926989 [Mycena sanguinolenta]|nr:hypothetical protein C8R45DRAFT_926989 [Mycena sanguinolenta]